MARWRSPDVTGDVVPDDRLRRASPPDHMREDRAMAITSCVFEITPFPMGRKR
jgi:hypothetical protein